METSSVPQATQLENAEDGRTEDAHLATAVTGSDGTVVDPPRGARRKGSLRKAATSCGDDDRRGNVTTSTAARCFSGNRRPLRGNSGQRCATRTDTHPRGHKPRGRPQNRPATGQPSSQPLPKEEEGDSGNSLTVGKLAFKENGTTSNKLNHVEGENTLPTQQIDREEPEIPVTQRQTGELSPISSQRYGETGLGLQLQHLELKPLKHAAAATEAESEATNDVAGGEDQLATTNTTTNEEPIVIGMLVKTRSGIEVPEGMRQLYGFPCWRCCEVGHGYTECVTPLKKNAKFCPYCGCRGVFFARCACKLGAGIMRIASPKEIA